MALLMRHVVAKKHRRECGDLEQEKSLPERPTSPSLLRLVAGLMTSSCFVAMMHWLLHPGDPHGP